MKWPIDAWRSARSGSVGMTSSRLAAGRDVAQDVDVLAGLEAVDEPGPDSRDADHAELALDGRQAPPVAELLRERGRAHV